MSLSPQKLAQRLREEGQQTVAFFEAIPPDQWERQVYTDGESWSIRQILAHIAQSEDGIYRMVAHIVSGGEGVPEDFDLDRYNQHKVQQAQDQSPSDLIAMFSERRAVTVRWVSALSEEDLQKTGRHPWLGESQIADMLKLMYRHVQLHQRDIRKLLKGL